MSSKLFVVKNMVCHRCVLAVENILKKNDIPFDEVREGEIQLQDDITSPQLTALDTSLKSIGLELVDNRQSGLVEKIKLLVIKKARNETNEKDAKLNLSNYLSDNLHYEYTYLSSLFSSVEGRTIENFFITERIEKAKELLVYGEMNLSEIAYELEYSSVAHLSSQFKKITGLTPSHFKTIGARKTK
ncbi:MAG TPA: AraC family transcriptional regulator [Flavitalea sp.]|nr:AraC family transcriptional regulator [Flavitalea sp.]